PQVPRAHRASPRSRTLASGTATQELRTHGECPEQREPRDRCRPSASASDLWRRLAAVRCPSRAKLVETHRAVVLKENRRCQLVGWQPGEEPGVPHPNPQEVVHLIGFGVTAVRAEGLGLGANVELRKLGPQAAERALTKPKGRIGGGIRR